MVLQSEVLYRLQAGKITAQGELAVPARNNLPLLAMRASLADEL
jgi:hypothetical protein